MLAIFFQKTRIGRALLEAKQSGGDPFAAIEAIIPWDAFSESITEAETLARPEDFDFLSLVGDGFTQLRRYTPTLLEALDSAATSIPAPRASLSAVARRAERSIRGMWRSVRG